jgi:hypothetical protein
MPTIVIREGVLTFPGDPPFKNDSFFYRLLLKIQGADGAPI